MSDKWGVVPYICCWENLMTKHKTSTCTYETIRQQYLKNYLFCLLV